MPNPNLTIADIARKVWLSEWRIRLYLKAGTIPAYRVGGVWRFDLDEINDWLKSRHQRLANEVFAKNTADGQFVTATSGKATESAIFSKPSTLSRGGRISGLEKREGPWGDLPGGLSWQHRRSRYLRARLVRPETAF